MKVSIIIPVFNEEDKIISCVKELLSLELGEHEIIIVDDGSTDRTAHLLNTSFTLFKNIKIRLHHKNKGKGAAIRTGMLLASGRMFCIFDADNEYSPKDLLRVINAVRYGQHNVCYGSRFLKKNKFLMMSFLANKFLSLFTSLVLRQKVTDMETAIKAFRSNAAKHLDLKECRFGIEPEITCKLSRYGYNIHEIPINYNPRTNSEGKKIRPMDGIMAI